MESRITSGLICLRDEFGFEYTVAEIEYEVWENEEYEYRFMPDYSVVGLMNSSIFQGIPGLNLEKKKSVYIRRNIVPVFISERSPGPNREDLRELLERYDMDYLDRLEWLIRTDMHYVGDNMYVIRNNGQHTKKVISVNEEIDRLNRSCDIERLLLEHLCHGDNVMYNGCMIRDSNRKSCYNLLMMLYKKESNYLRNQHIRGIELAKERHAYQGRKPIATDDLQLFELWQKCKRNEMTYEQAAEMLNISRSTFCRRIKAFK